MKKKVRKAYKKIIISLIQYFPDEKARKAELYLDPEFLKLECRIFNPQVRVCTLVRIWALWHMGLSSSIHAIESWGPFNITRTG